MRAPQFLIRLFLSVCFFLLACCVPSFAQQPKVLVPHRPVPPRLPYTGKWHDPAVLRSMVGGLWMIDANFKFSIYLKNDIKVAPITVTPILYLSNGQRYQLQDVSLEPSGTAVISINQALSDQGIAPWGTLSGYVEIQYAWPWDALCVTIRNVDQVHSLIFSYDLQPAVMPGMVSVASGQSTVLEGLWWK